MDPVGAKKRPGGDLESAYAQSTKVPKLTAATHSPHSAQPPAIEEYILSPEEEAMVRNLAPHEQE